MRIVHGSITELENIDAIVNAANAIGVMGAGVAGAIARSGGDLLLKNVKDVVAEQGPFQVGDVYFCDAGLLKRRGIKLVYHAVTMRFPGGQTRIGTIAPLLRRVLDTAIANGLQSIAFGGLGWGIGGLSKTEVANRMATVASDYSSKIKITVVDTSEEFIESFTKFVTVPAEISHETKILSQPTNPSPEQGLDASFNNASKEGDLESSG